MEQLVVVEVFNPDPNHQALMLRCRDKRHWIFLFVQTHPVHSLFPHRHINFGDIIHAKSDEDGLFTSTEFWLDRGPALFKILLHLDDFPPTLIQNLILECPGNTTGDSDDPPQMYNGYQP